MIETLSFSNFKSWVKFGDTRFGGLTAFFGPNSSGKTGILEFILLLKQTGESSDRSQVLQFGADNDYAQLGSFSEIVYNHDAARSIEFDLSISWLGDKVIYDPEQQKKVLFRDNKMTFHSMISQTPAKRVYVQESSYGFAGQRFNIRKQEKDRYAYALSAESTKSQQRYEMRRVQGRPWPLPEPVKFYGFPDQTRSYYQNAGFLFDLQLYLEEFFAQVYYLGPLREYPRRQYTWTGSQPSDMGRRGERCVEALLSARLQKIVVSRGKHRKRFTVEEYVAYWLRELGLIHDFSISEVSEGTNIYQVKVQKNRRSPAVLLTDVGFGVSQILPVLTLCYYVPEGSTLLIEQPEIHLHPRVQAGLADVFIDAISNKRIQIIVESHSEHLLRRLQRRIAEQRIDNGNVAAYFCENRDDKSSVSNLQVDMFGNVRNWPKHFFGDEMGEMLAMEEAIKSRHNNG